MKIIKEGKLNHINHKISGEFIGKCSNCHCEIIASNKDILQQFFITPKVNCPTPNCDSLIPLKEIPIEETQYREYRKPDAPAIELSPLYTCHWKENDTGQFETQCNNMFEFITGTAIDNKFNFCCFCGKIIVTN